MASRTMKTYRRRQLKKKKRGGERRRKLRSDPPRTLPLDEAPSGEELKKKKR